MMRDETLAQQYAVVGLDGLESLHPSAEKTAVVRAIAAARLLEGFLPEQGAGRPDEFRNKLKTAVQEVKKLNKKEFGKIEREMAGLLEADGALEEVPSLLACDMYYDTAGISMKTYRSGKEVYLRITEGLRAEILEEGPVTQECFCLIWLLRESGCIHEIFSGREQEQVERRMTELAAADELRIILWEAHFFNSLESLANRFLRGKKKLFANPYLEGMNQLFPFLERRQAIFIDYVIFGTSVQNRRIAMITYLTERGHYVEEVKSGSETLLKIDNSYYRVFPKTVVCARVPIQGANLLPVYW